MMVRAAGFVLADEPTAALDGEWRMTVLEILQEEAARGLVVIIASHDPDVLGVCTAVVHLESGRLAPTP